jgi:hypothetical protein
MPRRNKLSAQYNIYIDSDVIVASEIDTESHYTESRDFIKHVIENKDRRFVFFTSVFTSLELASAMIRRTQNRDKAYSLLYRVQKTWKRSINPLAPMPPKEMTSFTRLVDDLIETTIRFNTPSGDTIHAHTAALWEMHCLVTWNKLHFKGLEANLIGIRILDPNEMLAELKASSHKV